MPNDKNIEAVDIKAPAAGRAWLVRSQRPGYKGKVVNIWLMRLDKDLHLKDETGKRIEWSISPDQLVAVKHKQIVAEGEVLARGATESPPVVVATEPWPKPRPFAELAGSPFPLEALAPWHRTYVEELAEQCRIAADGPAVLSLGALAASAAKSALVQVQANDEYPLNLFLGVVAPSGSGKTVVLGEVRSPIDECARQLRSDARQALGRYEARRRVEGRRIHRLEKEASQMDDVEERMALIEAVAEARAQLRVGRPIAPQLTTGDPTQAALVSLLAGNGRMLLATDEGDQLFSRVRQRSPKGAEDIEALLQAYSGAPIERDVQGHSIRAANPALSIILGIQPGPFSKVFGVRAYHDKGLLARFLFAVVPKVKRAQIRDGLREETRQQWKERIQALLARPIFDRNDEQVPRLIFEPRALDRFAEFGAEIAASRVPGGELSGLLSWENKLWGATARISGLLHLADNALRQPANTSVSLETVERAITIANYFRAHAVAAYKNSEASPEEARTRLLLAWITGKNTSEFRRVEVTQAMSGRLSSKEIDQGLQRLVDAGYLREKQVPRNHSKGRVPKPNYLVNPGILQRDRRN